MPRYTLGSRRPSLIPFEISIFYLANAIASCSWGVSISKCLVAASRDGLLEILSGLKEERSFTSCLM